MPIPVLYQKTGVGPYGQRNYNRAVFISKLSEDLKSEEDNLDKVIKDIKELVSRFEKVKRELKIESEIKNSSEFFNAQYLKDPDYNLHEKALEMNNLLKELMPKFIYNVNSILKKVEESESSLGIEKQERLRRIARIFNVVREIADEEAKIAKYDKKKAEKIVEDLRKNLKNSYKKIEDLKKLTPELLQTENSIKNQEYKIPFKLKFLALMNSDAGQKTIFMQESKLEEEISNVLNEFEATRRRYGQLIEEAKSTKEEYDLAVRLSQIISWLKNTLMNLLNLYEDHICNTTRMETKLELYEIKTLSRVKDYSDSLVYLPPLFKEIFEVDDYLANLRELIVNVSFYSEQCIKNEQIADKKINELSEELKKLDYMLWEEEDLIEKIKGQEQTFDIIPREVNIAGTHGVIISGDLYLKDPNYKPKVGIICIPGIGSSRRIYYPAAVRAAQMGFLVYVADIPSQGYSIGEFKFGPASENFLLAIRHLKQEFNLEKIGLAGFSLGAMGSLFSIMHYTKEIEDEIERIDRILIKLAKRNINYEEIIREIVPSSLTAELKSLYDAIDFELKNIKSKKDAIKSMQMLEPYIRKYEEFFQKELIVVSRSLIESKGSNLLVAKDLDNIILRLEVNKIPEELAKPLNKEEKIREIIFKFSFNKAVYQGIDNLFSSCYNTIKTIENGKIRIRQIADYTREKLNILKPETTYGINKDALIDSYRQELKSVIVTEYEKYRDCKIDALLLLSAVDYPQIFFKLKPLHEKLGDEWFEPLADVLLFVFYREFARGLAENSSEKVTPSGSRFYLKKSPYIKAVKDRFEKNIAKEQAENKAVSQWTKEDYEKALKEFENDSRYNKGLFYEIKKKLKLIVGEDVVQMGALRIWGKQDFKNMLLAPSQFKYFALLKEMYPEILVEIEHVPKMAIFGAEDKMIQMPKRKDEIISIFKQLGNIKITVLEGMGHDLDLGGHKHNLYMNPVFTKCVYDFFLLLANT